MGEFSDQTKLSAASNLGKDNRLVSGNEIEEFRLSEGSNNC